MIAALVMTITMTLTRRIKRKRCLLNTYLTETEKHPHIHQLRNSEATTYPSKDLKTFQNQLSRLSFEKYILIFLGNNIQLVCIAFVFWFSELSFIQYFNHIVSSIKDLHRL